MDIYRCSDTILWVFFTPKKGETEDQAQQRTSDLYFLIEYFPKYFQKRGWHFWSFQMKKTSVLDESVPDFET